MLTEWWIKASFNSRYMKNWDRLFFRAMGIWYWNTSWQWGNAPIIGISGGVNLKHSPARILLYIVPICLYISNLRNFKKLGLKLGFTLGYDSFGYGLRIPHYGTIVVGAKTRFGNYTCIHTSTCVTNTGKTIGNGCYIATGVKITTHLSLADNIKIGANSVVNKPFGEENIMIAGAPAVKKKDSPAWYLDEAHKWKYEKIESLRRTMGLI